MRCRFTPAVALLMVLLLCHDSWAGSPTEQLRGFFIAATRVLHGPEAPGQPEQRLTAIRAMVGDIFDFRAAAQLSLGPDWDARTPIEREEFVRLFADFLERSLILGIASRVQLADGVKVSYLAESVDGALASVWTTIVIKSGLDLPFNYRMIERGDRWAVRDVVIDGVSLAANYRAQFARVIQASSYLELVRQMQARVSRLPALSPVVAIADTRAIVPLTPVPAPPAVMWKESTGVTSRPESPETPADTHRGASAMDTRSPQRPLPEPISLTRAPLAPPPTPPTIIARDGWAREEWAAPPREERVPGQQLQLVWVAPSANARASSYWVQVGAFKNPEAARRLTSRLREQEPAGLTRWAVIVDTGPMDTRLARVRLGPFASRAEAVSKLRELQGQGYHPFIAQERD